MKFSILSLQPDLIRAFSREAIIGRAVDHGLIEIECFNFREDAKPPHYQVDDHPYGGGPGMLLRPEPIAECLKRVARAPLSRRILLSARGPRFTQAKAAELRKYDQIVLVCGRYEGVDQRVADHFVDEELSIGDFVLMGGELAAMVVIESVARLIPGVLGNRDSLESESFSEGLRYEYPQYTRPREYEGYSVPEVLLSGDHQAVSKWRNNERP